VAAVQDGELVPVATGLRLRGAGGRLTGTLIPGGIDQLEGREAVLVGRRGGAARRQEIESYSVYGRRVVVKFRGVDSADGAAQFEGQDILIPCNGLVDLPEGAYYIFELVGMRVVTRQGLDLGTVKRVIANGGAPLIAIETNAGAGGGEAKELLVPAARSICSEIDRTSRVITIDPPEGLLELYGN
jgi:16S rRNA processing protein RimM